MFFLGKQLFFFLVLRSLISFLKCMRKHPYMLIDAASCRWDSDGPRNGL